MRRMDYLPTRKVKNAYILLNMSNFSMWKLAILGHFRKVYF